ncbi:MAG TPA: hypothetical protein PLX69_07860 [Leptospiraceae bacterium]|nr:hypothetical protein [Leptospiraceae bacterium]HRG74457.1 hypothetical protein [Leptospiraceae bacterium]
MNLLVQQKKFEKLPDLIQKQLFDYIDFLYLRYNENEVETDLTPTQKEELISRHKKLRKNPKSGVSLKKLKQKVYKKYAL